MGARASCLGSEVGALGLGFGLQGRSFRIQGSGSGTVTILTAVEPRSCIRKRGNMGFPKSRVPSCGSHKHFGVCIGAPCFWKPAYHE